MIIQNLSALAQVSNIAMILPSFDHSYNCTIISFAENIYNGNFSLKAVKIKQRTMEYMIKRLKNNSPNSEKYKTQKAPLNPK